MKLLNSPFSLLPSQFLGMRSLIRHGLDSAGLPDTFWSAVLTDAPLPCQMQPYFVARLEPTRMRWEDGQVHMTSLETREANVQECNGVKSVQFNTHHNTRHNTHRNTHTLSLSHAHFFTQLCAWSKEVCRHPQRFNLSRVPRS